MFEYWWVGSRHAHSCWTAALPALGPPAAGSAARGAQDLRVLNRPAAARFRELSNPCLNKIHLFAEIQIILRISCYIKFI